MATTEEERQRQQPISSLNPAFSMQVRPESQRPATGIYGTPRPPAPEGSWVEAPRAAPAAVARPAPAAPALPALATRTLEPSATGTVLGQSAVDANSAAARGDYAQAVAQGVRGLAGAIPALAVDTAEVFAPAARGFGNVVSTLFTGEPMQDTAPAAARPVTSAVAQPAVQPDSIRSRGQQSPTAPPISVQLGAGAGSAVPGAYRSTAPDGRVLYSDQPGAVSSVAALPSAQNSAAATALSDRSRVESLVATYGLDKARALLHGQPAPEATDPRALLLGQIKAAIDRNAPLTRSGAAVLTSLAASDAQAATSRGQQDTERRRVKVAEDEARIRNTAAITKMAAEQRYAAALAKGDEKEIKAAEDNLRAVQGKWEKAAPPDKFVATQINGGIDPVTGMQRGGGVVITNQADGTSRVISPGDMQAGGGAPLPPGMVKQVGTSNGKPVYEDKNGKKFIGS